MAIPFILAGLSIGKGILDFVSAENNASVLRRQAEWTRVKGDYARSTAENQAKYSELQAEDATAQGYRLASQVYRRGTQVRGAQRVALAGQGIRVDTGSAADVQAETSMLTELDMVTAKNNAWREAFGYKVQAGEFRSQGAFAQLEARNQAAGMDYKAESTAITGGLSFFNSLIGAGGYLYGQYGGNSAGGTGQLAAGRTAAFESTNWSNEFQNVYRAPTVLGRR